MLLLQAGLIFLVDSQCLRFLVFSGFLQGVFIWGLRWRLELANIRAALVLVESLTSSLASNEDSCYKPLLLDNSPDSLQIRWSASLSITGMVYVKVDLENR